MTFVPSLTFSPSGLSLAARCPILWAERYLHGVRDDRHAKGPVLGTLTHSRIAAHVEGRTIYEPRLTADEIAKLTAAAAHGIDVDALAQQSEVIATAALPWFPPPATNMASEIPLSLALPGRPWRWAGRADCVARTPDGLPVVYDLKTTSGRRGDPWAYALTPEALATDVQFLIYASSVALALAADRVGGRWVYACTTSPVQSKPVDVIVNPGQIWLALQRWIDLSDHLAALVLHAREHGPPALDSVPPPASILDPDPPCNQYGGCHKSPRKGGTCSAHAAIPLGALVRSTKS